MKPRKVYTPGCQSVKKGGVVDKAKDKRGRPKKNVMGFVRKNNYRTKYFTDTFKDAL